MLILTMTLVPVIGTNSDATVTVVATSGLLVEMAFPLYTVPVVPSTVMTIPSVRREVALTVPTTQGVSSSLDMMAAWQVMPPSSVTMPAALFMAGTMSGMVMEVTRISPSFTMSRLIESSYITTRPDAIPGLAPRPVTITSLPASIFSPFPPPMAVMGLA
ncbi:hypothetical protein SDC9_160476 [bioreactor metagenome]|uniref:Uncharacterized protein n=1 Tax=bioreactor metagenome TaxID=1076179 RepID=A0A645FHP5_9ZZZZ